MRGIAVIDRQPGASTIAVWVVSRGLGVEVSNVNAVVIDTEADPDATSKVHSLTRCCAVLVTDGSTLDGLPIDGEPLRVADLNAMLSETAEHQARITDAVRAYKRDTGSANLTEPNFAPQSSQDQFTPSDDSPAQRSFALANFAGRVWASWLKTDEERRRRTVQPKTNITPWIMPLDMNGQTTPDFPPRFTSRVIEQPLVDAVTLDYTAIDFETANSYRGSPCSVGLVRVRNGRAVEKRHWLIRPPEGADRFDHWNTSIHGITAEMVADAPRWRDILPHILDFVGDDVVVAHNAGFDIGVIRYACAVDNIPWPEMRFLCTLVLARRALALPTYRLPFVAESLGFILEDHHDALADANAVVEVIARLAERQGGTDLEGLARSVGVGIGRMSSGVYQGSVAVGQGGRGFSPLEVNVDADPDGYLYGRVVVFTGTLMSMTRDLARQECAKVGATPEQNTTKRTNVLVVGDINPAVLRPGSNLTGKARKAFELQDKGQEIEVMTEDDFLRCLEGNSLVGAGLLLGQPDELLR